MNPLASLALPALAAAGLLAWSAQAPAQQPETAATAGGVARFVEWVPHPGAAADFRAGYMRHLEWHRRHADPWTWHGWHVASGERLGTFIDASFGHDWAGLDHSIAPAEDGADNALNVYPHADATLAVQLVRLPAHSRGDEAEAMRAPMLATLRFRTTGDPRAAWAALDDALAETPRQAYRMTGGPAGTWLLAIPHADWAGFGPIEAALAGWQAGHGGVDARIEVLRRDPGMSYAPRGD